MTETNWKKYFGDPKTAGDTLEKILYGQLVICRDLCEFRDKDCTDEFLDNYHCNEAIKYFLQEPNKEEENNAK